MEHASSAKLRYVSIVIFTTGTLLKRLCWATVQCVNTVLKNTQDLAFLFVQSVR